MVHTTHRQPDPPPEMPPESVSTIQLERSVAIKASGNIKGRSEQHSVRPMQDRVAPGLVATRLRNRAIAVPARR